MVEGRLGERSAQEAPAPVTSDPDHHDRPAPLDRSWAATLALVIAAGAGAGALLVEAVRQPDHYYLSAVIALDLMVVMVVAGLAAVALGWGQLPRREFALAGLGTAVVTLALRLQNRQLQASTKDVLLLLVVATALIAWAALPMVRSRRASDLPMAARVVGASSALVAVTIVVASAGDIAPVRHARGWALIGAVVVAVAGLVVGARGSRALVGGLAALTLAARVAVGTDGRPALGWLALLAATVLASWTSADDRRRAVAWTRARGRALAGGAGAARRWSAARRAERRERRRARRGAIRPAPLHTWADLSPRARWMSGALALAAVVVVAAVTARARHLGWYPIGDDAIIATRAGDVGGRRTPLLGMPTTLEPAGPQGLEVDHPGPLLFWIYSPFVRLLGPVAGVMAGAAAISLASMGAACWAAIRARGAVAGLLAYAFVLGTALTAASGVPFEPLNAYAPILPLAATLVLAWAVASGVDRALAPAVAFASVTMQAYLPLGPTAFVVVLIATLCSVVPSLRMASAPRPSVRALAGAVLVGLVAWSGPIIDALANEGGNIWRLLTLDQQGATTIGPSGAWEILLRLTSLPPAWVEPMPFRADEAETLVSGGNLTGLVLLVAAAAVVVRRWSSWDHGVRRLVLVTAAALGTAAATLSRLPAEFVFGYQVGWVSVTAAFAAFAVAVVVTAEADGPPPRFTAARPVAAGAALLTVAALLVTLAWPGDLARYSTVAAGSQRAAAALETELGSGPRPGRPIAVLADGRSWEQVIANGVAMALEDRGRDIRVSPLIGQHWGAWRLLPQAPDDPVLIVSDGYSPGVPPVGRRIARVEPAGWSAERADRAAARVAAWARERGPITVRPNLGGLLRSVVAGWVPDLPCDQLEALMSGQTPLDGLPDGAIAQLYFEGVVATPALPSDLFDLVSRDLLATPTEVWLADASEARASVDGPLSGRCS